MNHFEAVLARLLRNDVQSNLLRRIHKIFEEALLECYEVVLLGEPGFERYCSIERIVDHVFDKRANGDEWLENDERIRADVTSLFIHARHTASMLIRRDGEMLSFINKSILTPAGVHGLISASEVRECVSLLLSWTLSPSRTDWVRLAAAIVSFVPHSSIADSSTGNISRTNARVPVFRSMSLAPGASIYLPRGDRGALPSVSFRLVENRLGTSGFELLLAAEGFVSHGVLDEWAGRAGDWLPALLATGMDIESQVLDTSWDILEATGGKENRGPAFRKPSFQEAMEELEAMASERAEGDRRPKPSEAIGSRFDMSRVQCAVNYLSLVSEYFEAYNDSKWMHCRIVSAMECVSDSLREDRPGMALQLAMSAVETLLDYGGGSGGIAEKLARGVGALLVDQADKRRSQHGWVKQLYGQRSKVAHGAGREASQSPVGTVRALAALVLRAALEWWSLRVRASGEVGNRAEPVKYEAFVDDLAAAESEAKVVPGVTEQTFALFPSVRDSWPRKGE